MKVCQEKLNNDELLLIEDTINHLKDENMIEMAKIVKKLLKLYNKNVKKKLPYSSW